MISAVIFSHAFSSNGISHSSVQVGWRKKSKTPAIRDFLKRHQIAFQAQQDEPEDHIGLMLMLAAYLSETRPHLLVEFLSQHLLTWAPHFFTKLANVENHPFYQGLAKLTLITLDDWKQKLNLSVPDVRFYR